MPVYIYASSRSTRYLERRVNAIDAIRSPLSVVYQEILERIPVIRVDVYILHAAPQTGLNALWLPSEDVHDKGPAQTGKRWPGVPLNHFFGLGSQSLRP